MRKLVTTIVVLLLVLAGPSIGYARGGMHGHGASGLMAANPSVRPSLTPDARLIGSAPLPHQQPTSEEGFAALFIRT
jgi:hypothetical protein